jgi:proline dehydrogenase
MEVAVLSSLLNRASRSHRARRAVEALPVTRRVVDRFVAGEGPGEAVAVVRRLTAAGLTVTVDVLGEHVVDETGARRATVAYLGLLGALAAADVSEGADVSLKPSAFGLAFPGNGQEVATRLAREICGAAAAVGVTVSLDMEGHNTVGSSLSIAGELRKEFPGVASVLQANLRRTEGDIAALAGAKARVRLVKGAYKEPAKVAFQRKSEVDRAYAAGVRALMGSSCFPQIATHDPRMISLAVEAAAASGRGPGDWELQMLYGIRADLQRELRAAGYQVRVYVPFGQDWYAYFMRRLAERPANVAFLARALVRP